MDASEVLKIMIAEKLLEINKEIPSADGRLGLLDVLEKIDTLSSWGKRKLIEFQS